MPGWWVQRVANTAVKLPDGAILVVMEAIRGYNIPDIVDISNALLGCLSSLQSCVMTKTAAEKGRLCQKFAVQTAPRC